MARHVRDSRLETRTARLKLPVRKKPYYKALSEGLHLGYRRNRTEGKWVMRRYLGKQSYSMEVFASADDFQEANGRDVLTYYQAQDRARALSAEYHGHAPGAPYTVREAVADYLAYLTAHGKSAKDTATKAEALILPELGDIQLAKLTTARIRAWHEALAKKPARSRTRAGEPQRYRKQDPAAIRQRKSTANRNLTILRAALNHAFREGRVATDAAWRRVQPFKGVDAARVRALTVDEARRLINACEAGFRPMVEAALLTGCRYGELTRLEVSDVHLANGTIHIRESKSGKPRHVVLTDVGIEFFRQLIIGKTAGLVFLRPDGLPWGTNHQQIPMLQACARARIEPVTFHELRHTHASLTVMAGCSLLALAQNLGHHDTRMVELHYGHLTQDYVKDEIRRTAPSFGAVKKNNVKGLR